MKPTVPGVWDDDTYADRMDWKKWQATGTLMILADKKLARWLAVPWLDKVEPGPDYKYDLKMQRCPKQLWPAVWYLLQQRKETPRIGLQRSVPVMATPAVLHVGKYRSDYERRLAASFDRLGIRYRYEDARLPWRDARGHDHVYTPDFTLPDLHMTFVEVKGPNGASAPDNVKMWHVVRQHAITLLLWDASVIDMIEDMQSANEVMGLLRSTRLAA